MYDVEFVVDLAVNNRQYEAKMNKELSFVPQIGMCLGPSQLLQVSNVYMLNGYKFCVGLRSPDFHEGDTLDSVIEKISAGAGEGPKIFDWKLSLVEWREDSAIPIITPLDTEVIK